MQSTIDEEASGDDSSRAMQYYDVIAGVYEKLTEILHGAHRVETLELLHLETGAMVLDAPTGTGTNLPHLAELVGPTGRIVGIDYSAGMLRRARRKVAAANWNNVNLAQADARLIDADITGCAAFDAAVCILGLSVIPDWQKAYQRMHDLVRPGGRIAIMDLYLEGKRFSGIANLYYRVIAKADQRRRFWEPMETQCEGVEIVDHQWFGGVARIVAGSKPGM